MITLFLAYAFFTNVEATAQISVGEEVEVIQDLEESDEDRIALYGADDDDFDAVYLSPILQAGDTMTVWTVTRWRIPKTVAGRKLKSVKYQIEIRCGQRQYRRTYAYGFDIVGKPVDKGPMKDNWVPIAPGTSLVDLHRIACQGPRADEIIFSDLNELVSVHDSLLTP